MNQDENNCNSIILPFEAILEPVIFAYFILYISSVTDLEELARRVIKHIKHNFEKFQEELYQKAISAIDIGQLQGVDEQAAVLAISRITDEDILELVHRVFANNKNNLIVYCPYKGDRIFAVNTNEVEQIKNLIAAASNNDNMELESYPPNETIYCIARAMSPNDDYIWFGTLLTPMRIDELEKIGQNLEGKHERHVTLMQHWKESGACRRMPEHQRRQHLARVLRMMEKGHIIGKANILPIDAEGESGGILAQDSQFPSNFTIATIAKGLQEDDYLMFATCLNEDDMHIAEGHGKDLKSHRARIISFLQKWRNACGLIKAEKVKLLKGALHNIGKDYIFQQIVQMCDVEVTASITDDFPSSKDIALMADGIDPLNDYLHIALHLDIGTVEADAISPTETSLKNRFIKLIEYWKKRSKGLTLEEKHQHIRQIIPQVIYQELYGNREEVYDNDGTNPADNNVPENHYPATGYGTVLQDDNDGTNPADNNVPENHYPATGYGTVLQGAYAGPTTGHGPTLQGENITRSDEPAPFPSRPSTGSINYQNPHRNETNFGQGIENNFQNRTFIVQNNCDTIVENTFYGGARPKQSSNLRSTTPSLHHSKIVKDNCFDQTEADMPFPLGDCFATPGEGETDTFLKRVYTPEKPRFQLDEMCDVKGFKGKDSRSPNDYSISDSGNSKLFYDLIEVAMQNTKFTITDNDVTRNVLELERGVGDIASSDEPNFMDCKRNSDGNIDQSVGKVLNSKSVLHREDENSESVLHREDEHSKSVLHREDEYSKSMLHREDENPSFNDTSNTIGVLPNFSILYTPDSNVNTETISTNSASFNAGDKINVVESTSNKVCEPTTPKSSST